MFGQVMDCLTTPEGKRPNFKLFTEERYDTIVRHKTSFYSFVLPIQMALYLAEIVDDEIHKDIEDVMLKIGFLFQAQDDYLDVFGDPKVTGKIGTDIADGKCSWIAVRSFKQFDTEKGKIFEGNYGSKHRVAVIEWLFDAINIKKVFRTFGEKEYKQIQKLITQFENKHGLNGNSFGQILNIIYKRVK
ncbi:farnesyl pyrophosphate synthase-like protein [Leptotrombidium deliense]|uniref:Farnesyl pyrophosphate synthase-like protein n=1 Tax=Leptotrombidium deliense TaxID=299467 RepID=A0A443RZ63_9ACAR|nr:farnesyl pyrophosphate synthase-like protein [Leptotrombidium deliense]